MCHPGRGYSFIIRKQALFVKPFLKFFQANFGNKNLSCFGHLRFGDREADGGVGCPAPLPGNGLQGRLYNPSAAARHLPLHRGGLEEKGAAPPLAQGRLWGKERLRPAFLIPRGSSSIKPSKKAAPFRDCLTPSPPKISSKGILTSCWWAPAGPCRPCRGAALRGWSRCRRPGSGFPGRR